jgi:hypothetical protein
MELCLNIETCEYNMQKKRIRRNARKAITTTSNVENYRSVMCLVSLYLLVLIHGLAVYCLDGYILLIFGEAWNLLHNGLLPY